MSVHNGSMAKPAVRSSSQRSVHEYPEHLNPFYEDENHKRLRFWKLGSFDKKVGRSNSFSIDSFKDFWSLKTFRLKKKSSTLGINRTSESPPMLRRDDDAYSSRTTINGQQRHTVDVGLANNFQRGSPYRCSLQELNSQNHTDNYFVRNNRYRSTIQASNPALMSSPNRNAPVTPVFRSRYSSQTSVDSTNPFEDDYLETMSTLDSPVRRSARKKRRAPPPPPLSSGSQSPKSITTVGEETSAEIENVNITNLTAEIESFVRTADTDKETIATHTELRISENDEAAHNTAKESFIEASTDEVGKSSRESPESNDFYPQDEHVNEPVTLDKIQNLGASELDLTNNSERCKSSPVKIFIRAPSDEDPSKMAKEAQIDGDCDYATKDTAKETVTVESEQIEPADNKTSNASQPIDEASNGNDENDAESEVQPSVEIRLTAEVHQNGETNGSSDLRITESNEDLRQITEPNAENAKPANVKEETTATTSKTVESPVERHIVRQFEVRRVPLKVESPVAARRKLIESDPYDGPQKPSRRRSVKDIIDSINKCQGLLKLNQEPKAKKTDKERINLYTASTSRQRNDTNNLADRNMNDLAGKRYDDKKMFASGTNEINNNHNTNDESYNIPLFVQELNESTRRDSAMFEKCTVRSENGKTDGKVSNINWNPVPKPRRHRHIKENAIE